MYIVNLVVITHYVVVYIENLWLLVPMVISENVAINYHVVVYIANLWLIITMWLCK